MACEIIGFPQQTWTTVGLIADFVGVALLGFDLVRLQRHLRSEAQENLDKLDELAEEYGGIEAMSEEVRKGARWISSSSYERYLVQDEVSYNAERAIDKIRELADSLQGLAKHVAELMTMQLQQANHDKNTANSSVLYSLIGMTFIAAGFALQVVGSWPC